MDENCKSCDNYLRSIVGECPQPCKRDKTCMGCGVEWKGEYDAKKCPECGKDEAYNTFYDVVVGDYDGMMDDCFPDFESAKEYAEKLVADGIDKVAICTFYDNGEDTQSGEGIAHFGKYYESDFR